MPTKEQSAWILAGAGGALFVSLLEGLAHQAKPVDYVWVGVCGLALYSVGLPLGTLLARAEDPDLTKAQRNARYVAIFLIYAIAAVGLLLVIARGNPAREAPIYVAIFGSFAGYVLSKKPGPSSAEETR